MTTASAPIAPPNARTRWWLILLVVVVAPLVLLVAGVAVLLIWLGVEHARAVRDVQIEVARIQAAGEPITTTDLYAFHRPAPGTPDTTSYWLAAIRATQEPSFLADAKPLPIVGEGDAATIAAGGTALPAAEQFLTDHDNLVQLTLTAASQPGECRLPFKFEDGFMALYPEAQNMRTLARLMSLRTRVAAARDDGDQAVESITANFAASEAMARQLTIVEHLIRIAILGVALGNIEFALNELPLTEQQLAKLQTLAESPNMPAGMTTAMLGERGLGYHAFHHMQQFTAGNTALPPQGEGRLTRPIDCQYYLTVMSEAIDASRVSFPTALNLAQQMEDGVELKLQGSNPLQRMNYTMTALTMPAYQAVFSATARGVAEQNLAIAAIAARRYQLRHGQLPANLAALVPEFLPAVPTDPFDGLPLRMKADAEGINFYSVGRDRIDNGGQDPGNTKEPDVVWRLKATPQ